jgi:hypothetical protein
MAQCYISNKKFQAIQSGLEDIIDADEERQKVLDLIADVLNFNPEAYEHYMELRKQANDRCREKLKERGEVQYSNKYYLQHRDEINAKRRQKRVDARETT